MDTSCENCKEKSKNLRRCTGCFEVYYCSKVCQASNWKTHKKACKQSKPKKSDITQNPPSTSKDVSSSTTTQGNETRNGSERKCTVCDVMGEMKFCQRCKVTPYCSKACQSQHWTAHKEWCNAEGKRKEKESKEEKQENKESRRSENTREEASSASFSFPFMFPGMGMGFPFSPMFAQDGADLSLRCIPSDSQWEGARLAARRRRPFTTLIDEISDIPGEPWLGAQFRTDLLLVAFISAFHHYRGRHCVYIQDTVKEEIYVAFYLDYDNPFPFFHWGAVRPGRFICIESPFIHYFLDGSVGLRIEDPSEVTFIDV
ncbi:hypothetical protein FSP39_020369 [Pinctada imbricata]|uniref:MYND-type domain-containing protein n=1 Tax=Pinctada imbricata TaxID=66713 RepID=A0AA88YB12_PINIB|nr:hypothetical protein FSP39_020369 [Pinctada imbricata]